MKLTLEFNGAQSSLSNIEPVIAAAGENTSVIVNTAQALSVNEWLALVDAAGNKALTADFNGAQSSLSVVEPVVAAAGVNTTVRLNTAQVWSENNLVSLVNTAGSKNLSMDFNVAQSSLPVVETVIEAAGLNTTVSLNTAQAWSVNYLVSVANTAGSKNLSMDFNVAQSSLSVVEAVVEAAGLNTTVSLNTAQAWSVTNLVSLANTAGSKNLSMDFNGAQSSVSNIEPVIAAAGDNTSVSVNTAQALSVNEWLVLVDTAGNKALTADFNGAQSSLSVVEPVVTAAGINTTVSLNTAQAWSVSDLVSLVNAAG